MFNFFKSKTKTPDPEEHADLVAEKEESDETIESSASGSENTFCIFPFKRVYENGIFQLDEKRYSKSYQLNDINYANIKQEEQAEIVIRFSEILDKAVNNFTFETTLYKRTIDLENFEENYMVPFRGTDGLDYLRHELNELRLNALAKERHNLEQVIVLTVTTIATDIKQAVEDFEGLEESLFRQLQQLTGTIKCRAMTYFERLDMLNRMVHIHETRPLFSKGLYKGKLNSTSGIQEWKKQGISAKDIISPNQVQVETTYLQFDDCYAQTFFVFSHPKYACDDYIRMLSSVNCNIAISTYYHALDDVAAQRLLKRKQSNIARNIIDIQRESEGMYDTQLVNTEIHTARKAIEEVTEKMQTENQKMFLVTFLITIFAETKEELKKLSNIIERKNSYMQLRALNSRQLEGYRGVLPLGYGMTPLNLDRLMLSYEAAIYHPFHMKRTMVPKGYYYGVNTETKDLIFHNPTLGNPNMAIIGNVNSGKSMFAKLKRILESHLTSDCDNIILDPNGEYEPITTALKGSVVVLSTNSSYKINPLDLNLAIVDDANDPIRTKISFVVSLLEQMIGGRMGFDGTAKASIISSCLIELYDEHVKYLEKAGKTYDPENCPTLADLQKKIQSYHHIEAIEMAKMLDIYTNGAYDMYNCHTTIDVNNRLLVFDMKRVPQELQKISQFIAFDYVTNRIYNNYQLGITTQLTIDEAHFIFQERSTAVIAERLVRIVRKFGGAPCFITQDVQSMYSNASSKTIMDQCEQIILLKQKTAGSTFATEKFNLSESDKKRLSQAMPGEGLFVFGNGRDVVPFDSTIPTDSILYSLVSTNFQEKKNKLNS